MKYFTQLIIVMLLSVSTIEMRSLEDAHIVDDSLDDPNKIDTKSAADVSTEFWEQIYQNSMLNTKSRYSVLNDERVCFTCPIDRSTFTSLYHEALDQQSAAAAAASGNSAGSSSAFGSMNSLPPLTITWAAQLNENRVLFFCRNNTRIAPSPVLLSSDVSGVMMGERQPTSAVTQLEYSCESNRLCLSAVKSAYPKNYQCFVKTYVLNVKLDVIGDSVKFDYQKEVTVQEGQPFTIKCEVPETNPVSIVKAYIDDQELMLTSLDKKTLDNRMTINTYSFMVNATRNMNEKKVKCEAIMRDLPSELANTIDLRSHLSKDYTLSVHYTPTCTYPNRVYKAGINRTLIIECPINASNPDVTYYKIIPPSSRTKFELIDSSLETLSHVGRFRITPTSAADFGLYECIPRSVAGTAKCDINVELGATPNPPEQCSVQFARVNNKTFAQFGCRPGHNQGGASSFLTIYELVDKQLKLSGRVNIDESKMDKEVPYITPADEDKYYEFLIVQENNYGNSSSVLLTLGSLPQAKSSPLFELRNVYYIAGAGAALLLLICVCSCCCCSDSFSSSSSKNESSNFCGRCCGSSDSLEDDGLTYKKAPMDAGSPMNGVSYSGGYTPVDTLHSNSLLKMSYKGNGANENYEYYDNTATGALYGTANRQKPRAVTYQTSSLKKAPNNYEVYNYELQHEEDDDDENINDDEELNYEDEDEDESMSSRSEKNTNSTSGGGGPNEEGSSGSNTGNEATNTPTSYMPTTVKSSTTAAMLNNVSGSIGSGVESIKKHTASINDKRQQPSKQQQQQQPIANTNNTYSTIDRNKKKQQQQQQQQQLPQKQQQQLIKTENGLVYTPIVNSRSTDEESMPEHGMMIESPMGMVPVNYDYDNFDPSSSTGAKRPTTLKKQPINEQFQNELSQKLKSIHSGSSSTQSTASSSTTTQHHHHHHKMMMPVEHMSNSTATTSISSASSCASNCDLIVNKKTTMTATSVEQYHHHYQPVISGGNKQQIRTASVVNDNGGGKNYSLLKTTINVSQSSSSTSSSSERQADVLLSTNAEIFGNGTLPRSKPPILKPKPRTNGNGIYGQINSSRIYESPVSLQNQSGDALLSHHHYLHPNDTSTNAISPSTSATDISSNNCTPQHNDEIALIPTSLKRIANNANNNTNRYNTNSLTRQQPSTKVTTTFGPNNGLYSTITKTPETTIQPSKKFVVTQQQNQSPLRKIDENNYETVTITRPAQNRTMERRHVKNSEI